MNNKLREEIAIKLHNFYEEQAKKVGWKTQDSCQVEFKDLPDKNKEVMLATSEFVINDLLNNKAFLQHVIDSNKIQVSYEVEGHSPVTKLKVVIDE